MLRQTGTRRDRLMDRQADSSIPPKHSFCGGYNKGKKLKVEDYSRTYRAGVTLTFDLTK